jgi:adenine-specific DNA-methyltransferase
MAETIRDLMPETRDVNRERLAALKALMPEIFTDEGKINEAELRKIVDEVPGNERYDFKWFGKSKAKHDAFTPTRLTLRYDEVRSLNSDKSENIIIEGENLEVMKLLLCSYREQVKCIYIDPPYNTGKDRVYSDNYSDERRPYWEKIEAIVDGVKIDANPETSGRFHSNWLSMIYSRLLLARQLLRKDGVIFISIDENEIHNLRKVCDEVFGQDNFIATIAVVSNWKGRSDDNYIATAHEYLIMYRKDTFESFGLPLPEEYWGDYPEKDARGVPFRLLGLRKRGSGSRREDRPTMYYPIFVDTTTGNVSLIQDKTFTDAVYPKLSDGTDGRWRWGRDTAETRITELTSRKVSGTERFDVFQIDYAEVEGESRRIKPKSFWNDVNFSNEAGTLEYKSLMGEASFTNPKPPDLIGTCLEQSTQDGDLVLDFFAGSGSTGQAVMELNARERTCRRFILVQLPEVVDAESSAYKLGYRKISDITIERNKRAATKILADKTEAHPELFTERDADPEIGFGFKVFRLETSYFPRTEWTPPPELTEEEKIASLKVYIAEKEKQLTLDFDRDKLLTEILIKEGFKLNYKYQRVAEFAENEVLKVADGEKAAIVCLDPALADTTVEGLRKLIDSKVIVIERALDTTKKWNLHNSLGEKFRAF